LPRLLSVERDANKWCPTGVSRKKRFHEEMRGPNIELSPLTYQVADLELVLERELDYPCILGADYLSEITGRQVIDRGVEVDLVERVEELCPELQSTIAFTDGEVLHQPEIRA
jgi:hypothetical protein